MDSKAYVVGVGMTNFSRPARAASTEAPERDYVQMAHDAARSALADARVDYREIEQAVVGYVYGDSCSGQTALYGLGETGIPVYNVNSNCSSGSSALSLARQLIIGGIADIVLALGFEQMEPGSIAERYSDRTSPLARHAQASWSRYPSEDAPVALELFGNAGREHAERYGTTQTHLAKIAAKNHLHASNNPRAQFREVYSVEEILAARSVYDPLTKLMCSPTSDGAAAAVLMSERAVQQRGLRPQAVEILAQQVVTDTPGAFSGESAIEAVGSSMSRTAAEAVYEAAGIGPTQIQVIELHDCFATNELITYEALALCPDGDAGKLIDEGATSYGGQWVVNPSGGLIGKGHPLGATGLAQCAELCWQLRQLAGSRQVPDAQYGLQHNLGLGGAAVVTMYGAPDLTPTTPDTARV